MPRNQATAGEKREKRTGFSLLFPLPFIAQNSRSSDSGGQSCGPSAHRAPYSTLRFGDDESLRRDSEDTMSSSGSAATASGSGEQRPHQYGGGAGGTTGAGAAPTATGAAAPSAAMVPVPAPSKGPSLTAFAFSAETAKVLHLVRHGQGFHNVEAAVSMKAVWSGARGFAAAILSKVFG